MQQIEDRGRHSKVSEGRVDEATYDELLALYREIGERLDRLSERASKESTETPTG